MSGRQKEVKETKKSSSAKLSKNGVRMLLRGEVAKEGVVLQVVQLYLYLMTSIFILTGSLRQHKCSPTTWSLVTVGSKISV